IYLRLPADAAAGVERLRLLQEEIKALPPAEAPLPESAAALQKFYLDFEKAKTSLAALEKDAGNRTEIFYLRAALRRALTLLPCLGMRWEACAGTMFGFNAEIGLDGCALKVHAPSVWFGKNYLVEVLGYRFQIPWHQAIAGALPRCLRLARGMAMAGIPASRTANWLLRDAPLFPLAWAPDKEAERFFCLYALTAALPVPAPARQAADNFVATCRELCDAVQSDEQLPTAIRQILLPTLRAAFQVPDSRDFLDADICRLALADGYVETYLPEVAQRHPDLLRRYRGAFAALQRASWPRLRLRWGPLGLTAFQPADALVNPHLRVMDPPSATPEEIAWQRCFWQIRDPAADKARWFMRYPGSSASALYLEAVTSGDGALPRFDGASDMAICHPLVGAVGFYTAKGRRCEFAAAAWQSAVLFDWHQAESPEYGGVALAFPPHLPLWQKDGRPAGLVLPGGFLAVPAFTAPAGPKRLAEQDAYLDRCAQMLATPGEMSLLMRYFIQYALDSPLARAPGLFGSTVAHGDYHQTVYEMLDRQAAGRILGDCEDVAELYQALCRRQGKNAYILALPAHAACAYVEKIRASAVTAAAAQSGDRFRLTILQSGPAFCFENSRLPDLLRQAEEPFLRNVGESRMTESQVPFLFRFAGEQVRTTYWLSSRIFIDPDYADTLIRVQSYWHFHVYHRGIAEMEKRLQREREIADIIELASLYRRVKRFDRAIPLQREVVAQMRQRDAGSLVKELTDLAAMFEEIGDREAALEIIEEVERIMQNTLRRGRNREYAFMQFARLQAAALLAMMEMPYRAAALLRLDMQVAQGVPEDDLPLELTSTLVAILQAIRDAEADGQKPAAGAAEAAAALRTTLETLFRRSLVARDDDFNAILQKYSLFGRYAVCCLGREEVSKRLLADGSYPQALPQPGERRGGDLIRDEDWSWFRMSPGLFSDLMAYYLNHRKPERFAPARALPLADALLRGHEAGKRLGSMETSENMAAFARLFQAIMRQDLEAAERLFVETAERGSTEQQKDLAETLGGLLRFLPVATVPAWLEVFYRHLPRKQFYLNIAYQAVDADAFDHALAAAKYACQAFPADEDFRAEAQALESILPHLKRQCAEREIHRQRRSAAAKFDEALAKGDFATAAAKAEEILALSRQLRDAKPLEAEALLRKARVKIKEGKKDDAVVCAQQALQALPAEIAPEYQRRVLQGLRGLAALCQGDGLAPLRQLLEERQKALEQMAKPAPASDRAAEFSGDDDLW
ncbi:MAG: hypothetical protein N3A66_01905, partial [Planctomycetota bacterium]|nr:hypothetical protein [Planctomycetota bacterium]